MMRVIIAGSRHILDIEPVAEAIAKSGWASEITEVVCGYGDGPDMFGKWWAEARKIPVKIFLPDWKQYGKAAGPIRNEQMAKYADALILVWDGKSKGSADMKAKAEQHGLKIFEHVVDWSPS